MARLSKVASVVNSSRRGFVRVDGIYDPEAIPLLHDVLGATKVDGSWLVPEEEVRRLGTMLTRVGYTTEDMSVKPSILKTEINAALYPFQRDAVVRCMQDGAHLLNFEMGLGKTPSAIETLRQYNTQSALVICPALVRRNWRDEIARWWPGHPTVQLAESGKQAKALVFDEPSIVVTSYELLPFIPARAWQDVILDESHYIKTGQAWSVPAGRKVKPCQRSEAVRRLLLSRPSTRRFLLTATPITSEPRDLWHQLDCAWPGRFGDFWPFVMRYCRVEKNDRGHTILKGLNLAYADELNARLAAVSSRVTKQEVAHLLPPFRVQALRLPPVPTISPRELSERWSSGLRKQHDLDSVVSLLGDTKVQAAVEQVDAAYASGEPHVCVLTHFKATAEKIARLLEHRGYSVVKIDGDVPIARRLKDIEQAKRLPKGVLVSTMHAVNVGIDLTAFTVAVFAELYYQPAAIIQALGRFSRLSGKLPSTCYLLVRQGSLDEPIAMTLMRRVRDQGKLWKPGQSESAIEREFDPANVSEEEVIENLRAAAAGRVSDEYL